MRYTPITYPPECPFCGRLIDRPKELKVQRPREFPLGICKCGAVYTFDVTGHNLGAAQLEALLFACNNDWDLAMQLSDEDYEDARIEHYDDITHKVVPGGSIEGRRVWGVLFFVKLHEDILEVTEEGMRSKLAEAIPSHLPKIGRSKTFSKREVKRLVKENRPDELIAMAEQDTRVITALQKLLYSADESIRWNTIGILGVITKRLGDRMFRVIGKLLQRLLYASSDSAASSWGALEATGEIISNRPDLFEDFTLPLLSFLNDKERRKEVTWAIGEIATKSPELVKYAFPHLLSFLNDPDASVRGYAAWSLGKFGRKEAKEKLNKIKEDRHKIKIYEDGRIKEKTVGEIAKEAIENIDGKNCKDH